MRQVWTTRIGAPETLSVREAPDPEPGTGEYRVRVKASGINFADIMARLGFYPDAPKLPAVMGYEIAGVVDKVGPSAKTFREGDKVIGVCRFGGQADTVILSDSQLFPLPEKMSFSQGAAVPVNYLTVYQMLFAMGSIKRGEKILVHSAAGGIGLAAIDLAKIAGAEVIGTASASKHEFLKKRGVQAVIDYHTQDFEEEVLRLTSGKGVHIILDPIGGESWRKAFRCLAPTGRLVIFGFSAMSQGKRRSLTNAVRQVMRVPWLEFNPLRLMNGNHAVIGVNLGHLWKEVDLIRGWTEQLLTWYGEGKIHPTVDKEFKLEEAAAAHHYIQDRKNIGKVVLVP